MTPRDHTSRGFRPATLWLALVLLLAGRFAFAQAYSSIVVIGDSLSDTGNVASLTNAKYGFSAQVPGPLTGYTNGRFTDGTDTLPPARNYTGVWIEQLAAQLTTRPAVTASLAGGRNYAYGFATTNTGTSLLAYGPGNAFSVNVNNMGQQLSDYLASAPTINSSTLFVVWGGANDLLNATSSADIVNAATREAGIVQALVAAGATDILVPNLPPLGLIPRLNGSPTTSASATAAAQGFNQALSVALAQVQLQAITNGKTLRLYQLDVYTLFNTVVGPPVGYGFANVKASSQGNAIVNPDTYLFWDDLHPTTYGHSLIAGAALRLLAPAPVSTTVSLGTSASTINLGSSVTLTATVTAVTGSATPVGTVTFRDGANVLGSSLVSGSSTVATATYAATSLATGSRALTATFTGVNGFGSATSGTATVTVVAPGYIAALSPTTIGIPRGNSGFSTLTITPVGGFTGSFTVACGTVSGVKCSVQQGTLTTTGTATSTNITIDTANVTAANHLPAVPGMPGTARVEYALLGLSLLSGVGLARRRAQRLRSATLWLLPVLLSLAVVLGISGCGSDNNAKSSPAGTYSVPVTITPSSGAAQTVTLTVNVM